MTGAADFDAFRVDRARMRCLAAVKRACGALPPGGVDLAGLGLDALQALERVFDAIRGATRAARLYKRLVDAKGIEIPDGTPGIEQAIILATGKPVPAKLKQDLPNLNPMTCWVVEGLLTELVAKAVEARKARSKKA